MRGLFFLSLFVAAPWAARSQESVVSVNTTIGDAVLAAYPQSIGDGAGLVAACDMDGDFDVDVVGAEWWSENVDGNGKVWARHDIDTQVTFIDTFASADFDLNGTIDLAVGSDFFDEGLALLLNMDGSGTNWARRVVALSIAGNGHLIPGDIDGDGDPDVVGVFEGTSQAGGLMWWENPRIGTGTNWSSHLIEEVFEDGSSVQAGDLDGDADNDLVVASAARDLVVVWLNATGDGMSWSQHAIQTTVDAPGALALGDVNGDGRKDLLVAAAGEGTIAIWFQLDGSGTNYQPVVLADDMVNPSAVQAVDLDGDLDLDVLAASSDGLVAWWENRDGSGTNWTRRILSTDRGGATVVLAADMDGDGRLNVLQAGGSTAAWWPDPYFEPVAFTGPEDAHLVSNASSVYAYLTAASLNSASGRWVATSWERTGSDPLTGSGSATGPFDLSGDTTITFFRQEQFFVEVATSGAGVISGSSGWLNRGSNIILEAIAEDTSRFERWEGDLPGGQSGEATIQAVVNGPLSFTAWFSSVSHLLTVYNPFGSTLVGLPGKLGPIESFADADGNRSCATGDFDNDGDADVIGLGETGGICAYWNQAGLGTSWQRESIVPANPSINDIAAGDLDGDGQDDLIVAAADLNWWTREPGSGSEWRSVWVSSNAAAAPNQAVCAIDLDHDGDQDIAVAGGAYPAGFFIRWYVNLDGAGRTWAASTIAADADAIPGCGRGIDGLKAGDIDGDGDADLLLTPDYGEGHFFSYWENRDGTGGTWSNHPICESGYYYFDPRRSADLADFDQDGDLDLLVPQPRLRSIDIWMNREDTGNGWTVTSLGLSMFNYDYDPLSGMFLDLNNDGSLDVVAALANRFRYPDSSQLCAFYNPGTKPVGWTNALLETIDSHPGPEILAAVSLDGDGTLDVLGYGGGGLACWRRPMQIMTIVSPPTNGAVLPACHGLQAVPLPVFAGNSRTQWVVSGWSRTGSGAFQGSGAHMPCFSFTNDVALTWDWTRQFKLDIAAGEGGETDVRSRWVDEDSDVVIHAAAAPYYSFDRWQGDTNGATMAGAMLSLTMDHAFMLEALFLPDLTSQGVPHAWLARHGWTGNFEEAAFLDDDDDSALAWMEYFADTNPTNAQSVLQINGIVRTGSTWRVDFQGGREASQVIEFASDLGPATKWISVYTNLPPTHVSNEVEVMPPVPGTGIFRVRAHR